MMRIVIREDDGVFVLEEVYSGVMFRTKEREEFAICMRDSGFEFKYSGEWYEAKNGIIQLMAKTAIEPDHSIGPSTGSVPR